MSSNVAQPRHADGVVVQVYKIAGSLRGAAAVLGISHMRVAQILRRAEPSAMRTRKGPKCWAADGSHVEGPATPAKLRQHNAAILAEAMERDNPRLPAIKRRLSK